MDSGATYRYFLESLWSNQLTKKPSQLTDKIANLIYDYSGGIPAYILKIYQEAQVQAIISGYEEIDERTIKKAIELLAIQVPKIYTNGTSISKYTVSESDEPCDDVAPEKTSNRGRKPAKRDEHDILALSADSKNSEELLMMLKRLEMLEVVQA